MTTAICQQPATQERIPTVQDIERNRRCYLTGHREVELPNWVHLLSEDKGLAFAAFQNAEGHYLLTCSSRGAPPPSCLRMRQIPPIHWPHLKSFIGEYRSSSAMLDAVAGAF